MEGLSEYHDRRICSYLLDQSVHFSHAGYHRMREKSLPFLIPCHKICCDGKVKLIYRMQGKVRLCEVIESLDQNRRKDVMTQIVSAVKLLGEQSLFQFGQPELEPEKIYFDLETDQIYIIYLPVYHENQAISIQILEKKIRKKIEILDKRYRKDTKIYVLQRLGSTRMERWELGEGSFVIGKQKKEVQCWVHDSKTLSRRHCEILTEDGQWWIRDLNSRNGTFLNKLRLTPGQWYVLNEGDQILAADCEFRLLCDCFDFCL